ncbi:hypothetical protein GCM10017600_47510 [Streptosporangium carneum]|uniref:Uncharacterized protein n=1 Tax=Streptosporangium carneum TaxID=47481 RepID=A0A9W6I5J0_9ACTN|nr:hypothetical protein GCM10017600_47510 [Streptosporangium carneum]
MVAAGGDHGRPVPVVTGTGAVPARARARRSEGLRAPCPFAETLPHGPLRHVQEASRPWR